MYRMAMHGRDVVVEGGGKRGEADEGSDAVDEEVVRVLKEAEEGRAVERVLLADRQLRHLPEDFGRIRGLLVLDVSRNQLQVRNLVATMHFFSACRRHPLIVRSTV